MPTYKIALLKGDGIGPEIVTEAVKVITALEKISDVSFEFEDALIGGIAIDEKSTPLPDSTIRLCKEADAVLLGSVGGPKWDKLTSGIRPEAGLLGIRKALDLYANIRPTYLYPALAERCILNKGVVNIEKIDLVIVRELTGGIYFGENKQLLENGKRAAFDTEKYNEDEIRRIGKIAFETARGRKGKLTSVDKANVLQSSRLWRTVMEEISAEYMDVEYENMLVDNCAMQLIRNPEQFDVICTSNIFGDILSDEASVITGSIGLIPSASLGYSSLGLYEPIHGSAPDIAGKNVANPIGTIMSAAMLLKYSLNRSSDYTRIENAVTSVLASGARTADIYKTGKKPISTSQMGNLIAAAVQNGCQ